MSSKLKHFLFGVCSVLAVLVGMAQTRPDSYVRLALWNGAAFVDSFGASLTNFPVSTTLTTRSLTGAQLFAKQPNFVVQSNPAANSQATASIAAEAAVRHVADCIGWSADASAAVVAAAGTVILRDGATGAGTVLIPFAIAHQVASAAGVQTVAAFMACGLNIPGTTNTAMTVEFNAGVTGEVQSVWLTGYNVQ